MSEMIEDILCIGGELMHCFSELEKSEFYEEETYHSRYDKYEKEEEKKHSPTIYRRYKRHY